MANLTSNIQRPVRGLDPNKNVVLPLAGYTNFAGGNVAFTIYKGAVVACDVSDTDGYFMPALSTVTWAAGDIFGGIALERADVTSSTAADGTVQVTVARNGVWGLPVASVAVTDVGAPVYVLDDAGSAQVSSTNSLWVGKCVGIDATYCWVDISMAAGQPNLATYG